jgi:hypothetical protein
MIHPSIHPAGQTDRRTRQNRQIDLIYTYLTPKAKRPPEKAALKRKKKKSTINNAVTPISNQPSPDTPETKE